MTCEEFERVLPELEGGHSIEQEAHLRSCSACSDLVSDLNAISQQARFLEDSQAQREQALTLAPLLGWKLRWLVPLAAAFLVAFGVLMHQHGTGQPHVSKQPPPPTGVVTADLRPNDGVAMASDDQQLLDTVAARMPSMRAAYETNLRSVNAYIRDAEQSAHSDPNDAVAQQYLMSAYEQKAMVYEMALDRSLP